MKTERAGRAEGAGAQLQGARDIARVLDTAVRLPGTNFRFGLDALLGLVPGLGDVTGAAMSGYLIVLAARLGVSPIIIARMLLNVGVDMLFGAVPLLGDVADMVFKANTRNLALLERAVELPDATRKSSALVIAGTLGAVVLLAAAGVAATIALVRLLIPG